MMARRKGYRVEEQMMEWFKGEKHPDNCVDFQTKTSLYEVKSCNLFVKCKNNNHLRTRGAPMCSTHQLGRFFIENYNHDELKCVSDKENKEPKYIFVMTLGAQNIWRVRSWDFVDVLINWRYERTQIKLSNIFFLEAS